MTDDEWARYYLPFIPSSYIIKNSLLFTNGIRCEVQISDFIPFLIALHCIVYELMINICSCSGINTSIFIFNLKARFQIYNVRFILINSDWHNIREDFPCHSTWKRCKHSGHFSRFRNIIGNFCIIKQKCYVINIKFQINKKKEYNSLIIG
jgi:hypothetical protein